MSFSIKTGAQAVATGARAVAKGTGVLLDFLDNASVKLRPLSHIPLIGDTIGDVQDLISMLHDYYHGEYKKVPAVVMGGTAAIVAYLVSPLDLVPDNIPLLGFVDDALIINLVMQLCIDKELDRYRAWREQQA